MEIFGILLLLFAALAMFWIARFVRTATRAAEADRKEDIERFKEIFGVEVSPRLSDRELEELQPLVNSRLRELRGAWRMAENERGPEFVKLMEAREIARHFGFKTNMNR